MRIVRLVMVFIFSAGAVQGQSSLSGSRSGAKLFHVYCQNCHSPGKSESLGPSLYHIMKAKKFDEHQMREMIVKGKDTMPPFGGRLTAEEIDRLIEYLKTL